MTLREGVLIALTVALATGGCGKKPAAVDQTKPAPAPSAAIKDSSDVFDEFYSEDTAGRFSKQTIAEKQTFSTAAGKSKTSPKPSSPAPSEGAYTAEFSATGRYAVQVSTVRSQTLADHIAGKLKEKGFPAYVAQVSNPTPDLQGTFHRVRVGGFDRLSAAKSFGESSLVSAGYEFWIDNKSNDNVGMEGYGLGSSSAGSYGYTPASATGGSSSGISTTTSWEQPAAPPASPAPETTPHAPVATPAAQEPPAPAASGTGAKDTSAWGKGDWGSSDGGW